MKRIAFLTVVFLGVLLLGPRGTAHSGVTLPLHERWTTSNSTDIAFQISTDGPGYAGWFFVDDAQSKGGIALFAKTKGLSGSAGVFETTLTENTSATLTAYTEGKGPAATFYIERSNNDEAALRAETNGLGMAAAFEIENPSNSRATLHASTKGVGPAGKFGINRFNNSSNALEASTNGTGSAGFFGVSNTANLSPALDVEVKGRGSGASFRQLDPSWSRPTVWAEKIGAGHTGFFWGKGPQSRGVLIMTRTSQPALQVLGGTKSAVVPTSKGARSLYTEEATEVWFSDYGFGRLKGGRSRIVIDPLYAETVDLKRPYHVFIQGYGDAQLYVTKRSETGFEVRVRQGDPNLDFSYRIVAKRQGYDKTRLEHVPSVDKELKMILK
jgi:hypothetical protein